MSAMLMFMSKTTKYFPNIYQIPYNTQTTIYFKSNYTLQKPTLLHKSTLGLKPSIPLGTPKEKEKGIKPSHQQMIISLHFWCKQIYT